MDMKTFSRKLRTRINDTKAVVFTTDDLIDYTNDGINIMSLALISMDDPEMLREVTLNNGDKIPDGWYRSAGEYPIEVVGDTMQITDGSPSLRYRYFAYKPPVQSEKDAIPFRDIYITPLLQTTALFCLNRNEYELSEEKAILDTTIQFIQAAKGGKT